MLTDVRSVASRGFLLKVSHGNSAGACRTAVNTVAVRFRTRTSIARIVRRGPAPRSGPTADGAQARKSQRPSSFGGKIDEILGNATVRYCGPDAVAAGKGPPSCAPSPYSVYSGRRHTPRGAVHPNCSPNLNLRHARQ